MELNHVNWLLIALVPIVLGVIWYNPHLPWNVRSYKKLKWFHWPWFYIISAGFTYGYMNLIIHQLGFYEIFFTDIMKGVPGTQEIVDEFMKKYGDKHRHFGHGVMHGILNAVLLGIPFLWFTLFFSGKSDRFWNHFIYILFTSALVGGLISEFV